MSLDVTALGLTSEPRFERLNGLYLPIVQIQTPSTALAETPPFADQCGVAKEGRLDREHIEPRHVTSPIATLKHEVLHSEFGHAPESQLPNRPSN